VTKLRVVKTFFDEQKTQLRERYCVNENNYIYGLYEEFYENGQINRRCVYINGVKHGLDEIFDIHGNCRNQKLGTYILDAHD